MAPKGSSAYLSDFIRGLPSSAQFFRASYLEAKARKESVKFASARAIDARILAELKEQNTAPSQQTAASLEKLKTGKAAAVLTGQQIGLFGGPLHTLYKLMSAAKIAAALEAESGTPVVPIFWMQTEDHDFEEIRKVHLREQQGNLVEFALNLPSDSIGDCVGRIPLPDAASSELAEFLNSLPTRLFREGEIPDSALKLLSVLKGKITPGSTLAQSFAFVLREVAAKYGVLLFDPDRHAVKQVLAPHIDRALQETEKLNQILQARNDALESLGYAPQIPVKPDATLVFFSHDGKRERLTRRKGGKWQATGAEFSDADLKRILSDEPERFTSSALLRPVFQDLLFPTAAYVCGPAEFNYWVQTKPLYEAFQCPQPLVIPRARFALLGVKETRLMEKLAIAPAALKLETKEFLRGRFQGTELDPQAIFGSAASEIAARIEKLRPIVSQVDGTLEQAIKQTTESVQHNLERLRNKYENALSRREETVTRQFEQLKEMLQPGGVPQERVVSFIDYLLKYGDSFLEKIFGAIEPFGDGESQTLKLLE